MRSRSLPQVEPFLHEKFLAVMATKRQDGTPLLSPVWYEYADGVFRVVVNQGDSKDRQLQRDRWLTLVIAEQAFPYRGVEVAGRADLSDAGAAEATIRMAQRYLTPAAARSYLAKVADIPGRLVQLKPERTRAWDFLDYRGSLDSP
jgi:PPOX class probable F420-dependent enzyme